MLNQKIKILIIDDDDVDRMMIKRALKLSGFNADVFTAIDMESGISLATEETFDCIFLDYNLPGDNGFQFLDNYKSAGGLAPVIMVTSKGDEKLAVEAMKKGASDYIPKNLITAECVAQILRYTLKIKEAENKISKCDLILINTEKQLETVISKTPLILFSIDQMGIFTVFKGKGTENLQISTEQIIGKSVFETGVNIPVQLKDYKNALFGNELNSHIEVNGRFYDVHYFTVLDNKNIPVGIHGIAMDITAVKKTEQELKSSLIISEETQKIKQQFLANMSHEIRTPIHGIMNLTDILLKTNLTGDQHKYLDAILKSGENLLVIINDILDLSKIEAQKMTFENTSFKLKEVVNVIQELFKPKADEKNILLNISYEDSLPETMNGDPVRLSQVLNNLVGNAIKFTHEGEVRLEISTEEQNEKFCLITFKISDTGIGIPQHKLTSIFDSFSQVANDTTRKYGGTGLGLSICKNLIELQGGMISVESTINKGSTFTFRLAFENVSKEDAKPSIPINYSSSSPYNKEIKILVVEDNEINTLVINVMNKEWGFDMHNASNGSIAIDMIEQNDYDVVLMDIEMPGMNGYETTGHIRKNLSAPKNKIPILAMTAHASTEEKEKCIKAGMNDYVSKPFDEAELKNKILVISNRQEISENKNQKNPASSQAKEKSTNLTYLREISENNDSFFKDFISLFLKNAPQSILDLETALTKKDWEGVRQAAHKIKPSLGYLGMKEIHLAAATTEDYAKKLINLDEIPSLIEKIKDACNRAFNELEQELKELTIH